MGKSNSHRRDVSVFRIYTPLSVFLAWLIGPNVGMTNEVFGIYKTEISVAILDWVKTGFVLGCTVTGFQVASVVWFGAWDLNGRILGDTQAFQLIQGTMEGDTQNHISGMLLYSRYTTPCQIA